MKHLLDFKGYTKEELLQILDLAAEMKESPDAFRDALEGKKLYMLFEKTSTRTYLSFSVGMTELGGTHYSQNWRDSNFAVGDVASETRYVGRNVDAIMVRPKKNQTLQDMAAHTTIPIINGCDDTYHPCQALADVMTVREAFGSHKVNLLYVGANNNTFRSLLEVMGLLGGTVHGFTPIYNEGSVTEAFYDAYRASGTYVEVPSDTEPTELSELIGGMDVVYTDAWVDMEYYNHPDHVEKQKAIVEKMAPYQINAKLLGGSKAKVMHDMPIHVGYEVAKETAERHMDGILNQAENRRHVEKAVLCHLLAPQARKAG